MSEGPGGAALVALVRQGLAGLGPAKAGLAVSGGGDSMALMQLCARAGIAAEVATVDHRLRPEAADEARLVARTAQGLGFAHETLIWDGGAARGNLADAARLARRALLAGWAVRRGLGAVVLAHTRDDVAETFLMRLARGAGVDGLAAMAPEFRVGGVAFVRPLLAAARRDLRDWLTSQGTPWVEDPTNDDLRYDRTRARQALNALAPLGLGEARLAAVAGHLAQARDALEATTANFLHQAVTVEGKGLALQLDPSALNAAPAEIRRRALVGMVLWLAPAPYAPRGAQIETLAARLKAGQPSQLAGARFFWRAGVVWACRNPGAPLHPAWRPEKPLAPGLALRPLGAEGLAECPDWRAAHLPRAVLLTAPSLWNGAALVAAPHAGHPGSQGIDWSGPAHPGNR